MKTLDAAWNDLRENMNDPKAQSNYYDLFLNATFFIPTLKPEQAPDEATAAAAADQVMPLIVEADGFDYLMLFDSRERLQAWAKEEVACVEVPGHVLAATSVPPLRWALNAGTEYSKQFVDEEIAWLKNVVEQCDANAAKGGA